LTPDVFVMTCRTTLFAIASFEPFVLATVPSG